ncbi:14444_t:CDS:2, partial [Gigaspora rosea]
NIPYTEEDIRWEDLILENNKKTGLQKLMPIREVSDVFVEVPDNRINIIIEIPYTNGLKIKNVSNTKITNDIDPYKWMSHAKNAQIKGRNS